MRYALGLLIVIAPASLVASCGSSIESTPSTTSSSSHTTTHSSTSTLSTSTWSSTSTTTTSTTTSTTTTSTTDPPTGCPSSCSTNADCGTCPKPAFGTTCCDVQTNHCFAAPTCPCVPGAECEPWKSPCAAPTDSCADICTCDSTDHWTCTAKADMPVCPAVHPTCGDPCTPSTYLNCMCAEDPGPGLTACACEGGAWACPSIASACPPLGKIAKNKSCTDFPANLGCDLGNCTCTPTCGTQVWHCTW